MTANPMFDAAAPGNVRTAQPTPVQVAVQTLAEDVFSLAGGSHHSLAIEMRDHIVVVDTPQN